MKKIVIEQSSKAFYSSHSGLALVGNLINGYTSLCERLEKEVPGQPRVSHGDVVKTISVSCAWAKVILKP